MVVLLSNWGTGGRWTESYRRMCTSILQFTVLSSWTNDGDELLCRIKNIVQSLESSRRNIVLAGQKCLGCIGVAMEVVLLNNIDNVVLLEIHVHLYNPADNVKQKCMMQTGCLGLDTLRILPAVYTASLERKWY
jgi:hypothetical protein